MQLDEVKNVVLTFRVPESLRETLREKYPDYGDLSKILREYALQLASEKSKN